MEPNAGNIKIVVTDQLTNDQKIEILSVKDTGLINLVERCKKIAKPMYSGIDPLSRPNALPANYQSDRLRIAETTEGDLMLDLFIYSPNDLSYGCSIYAKWQLDRGGLSRTVLEEYLSDKSFTEGIAAYRPDAPKLLSLLEDSVTAYEQAAGL